MKQIFAFPIRLLSDIWRKFALICILKNRFILLRNGEVLIIRGGKMYNLQGVEVK